MKLLCTVSGIGLVVAVEFAAIAKLTGHLHGGLTWIQVAIIWSLYMLFLWSGHQLTKAARKSSNNNKPPAM